MRIGAVIALGDLETALVGWHDEEGQTALSMVLTNEADGAEYALNSLEDVRQLCSNYSH